MKTKRLLVSLLAFLAVICMAFSVVMLSNTSSVMATSYTETAIGAGTFEVLEGASARTEKGTSGIKYVARLSPDFYNSVKDKDDVKFSAILAKDVEDTSTITLNAVDGESIKDVAWVAPETNRWGNTPISLQPYGIDEDEDGTIDYYQYNLILSFATEGRTDKDLAILYSTDYNVRAYVSYTESGEGKVIYSDGTVDTNRNLSAVAETVLLEDVLNANIYSQPEMAEAKSILLGYANAVNQLFPIYEMGYLEDFSASSAKTFSGIDVPDGDYQASINGSDYVNVTVTGGSFSIPALPGELTLGNVYVGALKGADGLTFAQQVKYVNQAIDNATELTTVLTYYSTNYDLEWGGYTKHNPVLGTNSNADGVPANDPALFYDGETFTQRYVVLAKDITIDTTDTNVMSDGRIFADILDGQGHTITATVDKCGLFNLLVEATIKNVGLNITNTRSTSDTQYGIPALAHRSSSAKVINTFINFDLTAETAVPAIAPFYDVDQWTNTYALIQNTYLHIDDSVLSDETTGGYLARCAYPEDGFWTQHVQGLYVVSKNVTKPTYENLQYGASNQTDATKIWHQMYYYATPAEMIAENASVGNWTINADGTATWNGEISYEALDEHVATTSAGEKYSSPKVINDIAYLEKFSQGDSVTLSNIGVEADIDGYNVTIGGIDCGLQYIEADSHILVDEDSNDVDVDLTIGETYQIVYEKVYDGQIYVQNVKYVSKVIKTDVELKDALTYYTSNVNDGNDLTTYTGLAEGQEAKFYDGATFTQRHYVLGNDITIDTTWSESADSIYMALCENHKRMFADIFDGQGYTITDPCFYGPGFFGKIGANAVIKNVKLDIINDNADGYGASTDPTASPYEGRTIIGGKVLEGAVLENLYLKLASKNDKEYKAWQGIVYNGTNFTMKNIVMVYSETVKNTAAASNQVFGYLAGKIDVANVTIENCVGISKNISVAIDDNANNKYVASNQTVDGYTSIAGVNYYSSIAECTQSLVGSWLIDGTWVGDEMTMNLNLRKGDVVELDGLSMAETTVFGDAIEINGDIISAIKTGFAIVKVEDSYETLIVTVIDATYGFTATATEATIAVGDTTSITIEDLMGKEYVGVTAYATTVDGIVSIANDGTITGVAAGSVDVIVCVNLDGLYTTFTVSITVE